MKALDWLFLFLVIVLAVTIGNLVALKIVADQVSSSVNSSPVANLLGVLNKRT
jgi:hypothetical protein